MNASHRSPTSRVFSGLMVAIVLVAPARVRAADPMETICEAFRASSKGLRSGTGRGRYRHYDFVPGNDWQLKIDAEISTWFDSSRYHVDLAFEKDEIRKLTSRRTFYDGARLVDAHFTPRARPTGADARVVTPANNGHGLVQGAWREFPWDVTNLAKNVWDPERLAKTAGASRIEIKETTDGDLVGTYVVSNTNGVRVRFECPRRFGFNLARHQMFNFGEDHPVYESALTWKQGTAGSWYVASLVQTMGTLDEKGRDDMRMRAVLMYSRFEPNAKVDPTLFTEESLNLPSGSPIVDNRPGSKVRIRLTQ